jgi:hypothetical protein
MVGRQQLSSGVSSLARSKECKNQEPLGRPSHSCVLPCAQVAEVVGGAGGRGRGRGPLQRFYPQCQRCSIKQAGAVRNGKRVLVLHLTWPRRGRGEQLAGVCVAGMLAGGR